MPSLWPHQVEDTALLARSSRLYVGNEMRTGKTPTTCVAARTVGVEHPVIFCPAIAQQVWREAWPIWHGPHVIPRIISYNKLAADPMGYLPYLDNDCLILDEAQYLRTITSGRSNVALQLANKSPRVWFLSGSPTPNSNLDLYPVLRAVWPDELSRLGIRKYSQYMDLFANVYHGQHGPVFKSNKNVPLLQDILSRVMPLRRTFASVAPHIPQLQWEPVELDISDNIESLCIAGALSDRAIDTIERGELPDGSEDTSRARRILGTLKAPAAGALIADELANNDYAKVVVLAYHTDVLDILENVLHQYGVCRVDGATPPVIRDTEVFRFQNLGTHKRVFLGQITAVGQSIDLSAAHHVVFVEQDWLPDNNRQAAMRIVNINKEHPVYARMLFASNIVDRKVQAALKRRMQASGEIFSNC